LNAGCGGGAGILNLRKHGVTAHLTGNAFHRGTDRGYGPNVITAISRRAPNGDLITERRAAGPKKCCNQHQQEEVSSEHGLSILHKDFVPYSSQEVIFGKRRTLSSFLHLGVTRKPSVISHQLSRNPAAAGGEGGALAAAGAGTQDDTPAILFSSLLRLA
jgi:hypothetical protein